jgi:hypothetical protein
MNCAAIQSYLQLQAKMPATLADVSGKQVAADYV